MLLCPRKTQVKEGGWRRKVRRGGKREVLSEREATGNCLVVSSVDSCPVLSDDGTQIQKEATNRLALSSCIWLVAPTPCG